MLSCAKSDLLIHPFGRASVLGVEQESFYLWLLNRLTASGIDGSPRYATTPEVGMRGHVVNDDCVLDKVCPESTDYAPIQGRIVPDACALSVSSRQILSFLARRLFMVTPSGEYSAMQSVAAVHSFSESATRTSTSVLKWGMRPQGWRCLLHHEEIRQTGLCVPPHRDPPTRPEASAIGSTTPT